MIDILREAGDYARRMDVSEITEQHVEAAKGIGERGRISEMISGLSPHGKYALRALTIADHRGDIPIRTKVLYDIYRGVCNQQLTDPLSDRAVQDHLSELELIGLVRITHKKTPEGLAGNTNSTSST